MGPLKGVRIVEMGGIGPGPFCALILADLGADVLRIDRRDAMQRMDPDAERRQIMHRSRRSVAIDLKKPEGTETVLKLIERADGLIEGFRPGVMERLGLGPDIALRRNERLVYGRMTGWGQTGPLANVAGHDINYIALSGILHTIGEKGRKPMPAMNLVGDFGGGAMFLAVGILAGILEARQSGRGQVVDAAMTDGSALMALMSFGMFASGDWIEERESNLLDGGAHFYATYETKDKKYISIGSIEPQFYALLREKLELTDEAFDHHRDKPHWPDLSQKLAKIFKTKTRDEWCTILEGTDVCFAPVLTMGEAPKHPHNQARGTFIEMNGIVQPGPSPRFSRTKVEVGPICKPGQHTQTALADWGVSKAEIEKLLALEAI